MLQPIIRCPSCGTKGQFTGATSISPSSPRPSLIESVRSNCPLLGSGAAWTFWVGTTWILHGSIDTRPISPKNQSKVLIPRHFQPDLSHLMAEAPIKQIQITPLHLIAEAPDGKPTKAANCLENRHPQVLAPIIHPKVREFLITRSCRTVLFSEQDGVTTEFRHRTGPPRQKPTEAFYADRQTFVLVFSEPANHRID